MLISFHLQISRIISDLGGVTFDLDLSEEEAGKVMKTLLQQYASATDSIEESAIQSIHIAALKLHITSRKDFLIEKRSIKKLLDKIGDGSQAKKKILIFLLNLLKKYENSVVGGRMENTCVEHEDSVSFMSSRDQSAEMESRIKYGPHDAQIDMLNRPTPPEDFRCPLSSRLLYDPVVIDSGQTFERMWIQKWFNEGHDTCPKTKRKLSHFSLTPNVTMKNLISKWCTAYGVTIPDPFMQSEAIHSRETSLTSIASLSNSMHNLCLPFDFSNVSVGSLDASQTSDSSFVKITDSTDNLLMNAKDDSHTLLTRVNNHTRNGEYLHKLDSLPWESQCKMVEDVKIHLKDDDQDVQFTAHEDFVEPLVKFLKAALDLNDVKAQRAGCLLLLAFVTKCRSSGQHLNEGVYGLLASFLNSEVAEEAVSIVEVLSHHRYSSFKIVASGAISSILQILEMQIRELHEPAIRILYNLSFDSDIHSHIVSTEFVRKLVPYFKDGFLARYCITILKNLCDHEHTRVSIVETDGCIASIANLLEMGSSENQEYAVTVLLSLCSQRDQYCQLVMGEGVIPALVSISINGNDKGKASAMELLRLFRDITNNDDIQECPRSDLDFPKDSGNYIKEQKPSSKPTGFFRKLSKFSKSAPKKKR